jgi:hypothetical protein
VNGEEIRAFVDRDRTEVDASRRAHWARRYREEGPTATFAAAQALFVHVRALRPEWPGAEARADDLKHHVRQKALLDRAARALSRR